MKPQYAQAVKIFNKNLNILLAEKGLEKVGNGQIAKMANDYTRQTFCNTTMMSQWRKGQSMPHYQNFKKLADWLDCEETDLLPEEYHEYLYGFWVVQKIFAH